MSWHMFIEILSHPKTISFKNLQEYYVSCNKFLIKSLTFPYLFLATKIVRTCFPSRSNRNKLVKTTNGYFSF